MSQERSLDVLLRDILDDFERLLNTAKNGPAKRRLAGRIERIKLALTQLEATRDEPRLSPKRSGLVRRIGA
jgi:hypothetical protein